MPQQGYYRHSIVDPHSGIPNRKNVQGDIDPKIFDYFFRFVLPGDRGPRQSMICTFFQKFYEACVLEGITPVWDETNEERINNVLMRMNFVDSMKWIRSGQRVGKSDSAAATKRANKIKEPTQ